MRTQSKYAAKGKPMPYSDLHQQWRSAMMAGRTEEAAELTRKHQIRFGNLPRPARSINVDENGGLV